MDQFVAVHAVGTIVTFLVVFLIARVSKVEGKTNLETKFQPWEVDRAMLRRVYYLMWLTISCFISVFFNVLLLVYQLSSIFQARLVLSFFILLSFIGVLLFFAIGGVLRLLHKEIEELDGPEASRRYFQLPFC